MGRSGSPHWDKSEASVLMELLLAEMGKTRQLSGEGSRTGGRGRAFVPSLAVGGGPGPGAGLVRREPEGGSPVPAGGLVEDAACILCVFLGRGL